LQNVSPVHMSRNIRGVLWSKLAINCVITTLGAVTGQTLGQMLRQKNIRRVFLAVYREVVDCAHRVGVKLEKIAAPPHLLYLRADAGAATRLYKDLLVVLVGLRYSRLRSSMLQSLERGRPTEIDYLNGYVVRQAEKVGLDVPVNRALVELVKQIEAGERQAEPANIADLVGLC
ncbi:MAG: 2-dehydropantoate 2-reductase, partial [Deltaproteobacteria bacterium]